MTVREKLDTEANKQHESAAAFYCKALGMLATEIDRVEASMGVKRETSDPNEWQTPNEKLTT